MYKVGIGYDVHQFKIGESFILGGVDIDFNKGEILIIGVGGVNSGLTAYEKIKSGASLLQLYTGMVFQGPKLLARFQMS